jgi:hypothetical protein
MIFLQGGIMNFRPFFIIMVATFVFPMILTIIISYNLAEEANTCILWGTTVSSLLFSGSLLIFKGINSEK